MLSSLSVRYHLTTLQWSSSPTHSNGTAFGPESDRASRRIALLKTHDHGLDLSRIACRTVELILSHILIVGFSTTPLALQTLTLSVAQKNRMRLISLRVRPLMCMVGLIHPNESWSDPSSGSHSIPSRIRMHSLKPMRLFDISLVRSSFPLSFSMVHWCRPFTAGSIRKATCRSRATATTPPRSFARFSCRSRFDDRVANSRISRLHFFLWVLGTAY